MLRQIMISFLLMIVGMVCYKCKIISDKTNRELTNFVLAVASPSLIIGSYQIEYTNTLVKNILISFVLSIFTYIIMIFLSNVLISKKHSEWEIERFSVIYSNCGFIGIPLVQSIYGAAGIIYLTSYITIFNLLIWTHGVYLISGDQNDENMIKRIATAPAILAVIIGIILFSFHIELPEIMSGTLEHLGNLNTPLAMIAAGVSVIQADLKKAIRSIRAYYICFLKLLLLPLICFMAMKSIPAEDIVIQSVLLAIACPTGATGIMFAIRYRKNDAYASDIFAMTTALSLITLPLVFYCCI